MRYVRPSLVTVAAWEAALGAGGSARVMVTDVVCVDTPAGSRLWVAVAGAGLNAAVKGLWRSDSGVTGPFVRVNLPNLTTAAALGLAAAPSDGTVVYGLADGPRVWRVDGDNTPRRVLNLPSQLFGTGGGAGQSEWDLAPRSGQPVRPSCRSGST